MVHCPFSFSLLGLSVFRSLVSESDSNIFPDNDLLFRLQLVTKDAEKCSSVAQQLLGGKRQTRCRWKHYPRHHHNTPTITPPPFHQHDTATPLTHRKGTLQCSWYRVACTMTPWLDVLLCVVLMGYLGFGVGVNPRVC